MNSATDICNNALVTVKVEYDANCEVNVKQELEFAESSESDEVLSQLKEEVIVKDEITIEPTIVQCTYYPVEETATTSNEEHAQSCMDMQDLDIKPLKDENKSNNTGKKLYTCDLCACKVSTKSSLNRHMLKHVKEKPFSCKWCSYKTTRKYSLDKHKVLHTGKQLTCHLCSYKSAFKSYLDQHILTHGISPFTCELCSYECSDRPQLNDHLRTHMEEKSTLCGLCSLKSKNVSTGDQVMPGEKPFSCQLCTMKSSRKPTVFTYTNRRKNL